MLETLVPSDPAELLGVLARHDLVPAPVIGAPVLARTDRPAAAAARSTMAAGRSAGLSVERGADAVLRRIADAEGKPVDGLESFDFQVGMVKALPAPSPSSPVPTAVAQPEIRRLLLDMRSAWKRGDGSSVAAVLIIEAQSRGPIPAFVDATINGVVDRDRMSRPDRVRRGRPAI